MSRIGKLPIEIPADVTVSDDNGVITVKGPKGELSQKIVDGVTLSNKDGSLQVTPVKDHPQAAANFGLMRSLLYNMVIGVTKGFEKKLELNGVGFRVNLAGSDLKFNLGYSHEVVYSLPKDITASIDQNIITVAGSDKQQVGQAAAEIRALRKPEPYKGKGIKYVDEQILRKSGKSGKEAA